MQTNGTSIAFPFAADGRRVVLRLRFQKEGPAEGRASPEQQALGCGEPTEERLEKLQIATSLTPYRFQEQNRRREVFVDEGLVTEEARGAGVACGVSL